MNKQWDLTILYNGFDDPKFASDMAELDKSVSDVIAFAEEAKTLAPEELLVKYVELQTSMTSLVEKLFIYANLRSFILKEC